MSRADRVSVERVWLRAARGDVLLALRFTEQGPVVSIASTALDVATEGGELVAGEAAVRVAGDASIEVSGALAERVAGSARREAKGAQTMRARAARIEASGGDLLVRANDDVSIEGARVLLKP